MKLDKTNSKEIAIYSVERETEKAVFVNCPVFWNDNCHAKSMWFPKSCVEVHDKVMRVAEFILARLSSENACHGYQMFFNQF